MSTTRRAAVPSKLELVAISKVLDMAIENSCSCNGGKQDGYLSHDKDCWVHLTRDDLKKVDAFLRRANQ